MNQYFDDWRRKLGFGKPACVMTEDEFEFEKRLESNDRDKDSLMYIRRALLEEIALYHPEKRKELVGTPEEYNSVVLVSPKRAPPRAIDHLGAVP